MKQSGLLLRQQEREDAALLAGIRIGVQYAIDTLNISLNEADGWGYDRQMRLMEIWRSTAEFVSKYFSKGRMAVVEGRLQIRDWTDKDGAKRRTVEVVADNVYFGDSKRTASDSDTAAPSGEFTEVPEDEKGELPF